MDENVLQEEILIATRQILRATELNSKRLSKQVGLTFPQLLLMKKLQNMDEGSTTASQLANALSFSQSTITSIVDRLVKRDLVKREKSTKDKRQVFLLLTESGSNLLETAPTPLQDSFVRKLKLLEDWEQTMILSALQKVATMMNANEIDASPVLEIGPLDKIRDSAE